MASLFIKAAFKHNVYKIKDNFALVVEQKKASARIKMLSTDPISTEGLPYTFDILKTFLPSVLTSECFNDQNLPFHKEVKNTEIGHLFEHILLEYMCQLKIAKGNKYASYSGRTRWNWQADPRGMFHIHINCSLKDADIFPTAVDQALSLMKIILTSKNTNPRRQSFLYHNCIPGVARTLEGLKNGKKLKKKKY